MIKTSGYRISPAEIEEIAYGTGLVAEAAALGVPHDKLGQAIVLVARQKDSAETPSDTLLEQIKQQVPNYMLPLSVQWKEALPRNANGKLDRIAMAKEFAGLFQSDESG